MTKNNKIEFDINKMNECFFASIHNRIANEIVFNGWELIGQYSAGHCSLDIHDKVNESIYKENGFVPPTTTEILNQFIDDIHKKLKKSGIYNNYG